jgi:hypothetical protein
MFERKWHVGISVLISLLTISLLTAVLITPPVFSQENATENAIFSVSPGAFTARQVPPMGEPYTIPQNIVVWNRDNVERVVYITSEIPPENSVAQGYEPIPNENWVTPFPSSVLIKENSFAVIQLSFNIPRWENLTGENWEVWIPVERQALPGEPIVYRPAVRIKIETTEELPAVGIGVTLTLLAVGLVIAVVVICTGVWFWSRRRGRGKPGKGVFFRR